MSLKGWQDMVCPECQGKDFVAVVNLIWQPNQGSSTRPKGYRCLQCSTLVDQAKMVAHAKKLEAEEKIKELEAEIHG